MNIYDRQSNIELDIPASALIIGVGGVGSWVAMNLALSGVKSLILCDPDKVESTNLNRTLFTLNQAETKMFKVFAIEQLIKERRNEVSIISLPMRIEDITLPYHPNIVIDCRDEYKSLPKNLSEITPIIGGYNGHSITFHINPYKDSVVFGDEVVRYSITPSWLIPPQIIASVITSYILLNYKSKIENVRVINTDIKDIINKILEVK